MAPRFDSCCRFCVTSSRRCACVRRSRARMDRTGRTTRTPAGASLLRAGVPYPLAIVGRLFRFRPGSVDSAELDWPAIFPYVGRVRLRCLSRGFGCVQRPHNLCVKSNSLRTPFRRYLAGKDPFTVFPSVNAEEIYDSSKNASVGENLKSCRTSSVLEARTRTRPTNPR